MWLQHINSFKIHIARHTQLNDALCACLLKTRNFRVQEETHSKHRRLPAFPYQKITRFYWLEFICFLFWIGTAEKMEHGSVRAANFCSVSFLTLVTSKPPVGYAYRSSWVFFLDQDSRKNRTWKCSCCELLKSVVFNSCDFQPSSWVWIFDILFFSVHVLHYSDGIAYILFILLVNSLQSYNNVRPYMYINKYKYSYHQNAHAPV